MFLFHTMENWVAGQDQGFAHVAYFPTEHISLCYFFLFFMVSFFSGEDCLK